MAAGAAAAGVATVMVSTAAATAAARMKARESIVLLGDIAAILDAAGWAARNARRMRVVGTANASEGRYIAGMAVIRASPGRIPASSTSTTLNRYTHASPEGL
ncbi:hypothetical protein GCM10020220_105290 [Nonomuraea rubra]